MTTLQIQMYEVYTIFKLIQEWCGMGHNIVSDGVCVSLSLVLLLVVYSGYKSTGIFLRV